MGKKKGKNQLQIKDLQSENKKCMPMINKKQKFYIQTWSSLS